MVTVEREQNLLGLGGARRARSGNARVDAPFQVVVQLVYLHDVTEADLDANLVLAGVEPFDMLQLDNGSRRAMAELVAANGSLAHPLDAVADRSGPPGRRPGV